MGSGTLSWGSRGSCEGLECGWDRGLGVELEHISFTAHGWMELSVRRSSVVCDRRSTPDAHKHAVDNRVANGLYA
jgi:hypothetical protein